MSTKSAAPKKTIAKPAAGGQLSLRGFFTPKDPKPSALTPNTESQPKTGSQPKAVAPPVAPPEAETPAKATEAPAAASSSQPEADPYTPEVVSLSGDEAADEAVKSQGAPELRVSS